MKEQMQSIRREFLFMIEVGSKKQLALCWKPKQITAVIHQLLGLYFFWAIEKCKRSKYAQMKSIVNRHTSICPICAQMKNQIFRKSFEIADEWKTRQWKPHESRTWCTTLLQLTGNHKFCIYCPYASTPVFFSWFLSLQK